MQIREKMRFSSLTYFISSIVVRWIYNAAVLLYHNFSVREKMTLHLILAMVSLLLGWLAFQLYRKAKPTGSNLGCFYLVLLFVNLLGGLGALFFALVQFFSAEGGSETLWLL